MQGEFSKLQEVSRKITHHYPLTRKADTIAVFYGLRQQPGVPTTMFVSTLDRQNN